MNRKLVIIGAGLGGLGLAVRMAAAGWRVTVCEQNAAPGGKMNRWETGGFRFDTGPSLITLPEIFADTFRAGGADLRDHVEFLRVCPLAHYTWPDGTRLAHTPDLPAWLADVRRLEGRDASGFLHLLDLGAQLFELSKATFFARSPFERPVPPDPGSLRHLRLREGFAPYARVVARHLRSPHLRQLFERYMTYVGSSPYACPSTLMVIPYLEYALGVWHVRGGLYRIVEALTQVAQQKGVEFRFNAPVTAIRRDGERISGVELADGTRLDADAVAMNGDASLAPVLLGEPGARPLPEALRSMSGFIQLFALRRTRPDLPHHSVFFSADYRREFHDLFGARRFPDDPTVYVNMPSRTDRSMTPGEGEVMFVMANAPANDGDAWDGAAIAAARARVLRRLHDSGFPAFEDEVIASEVWTPRRLATQYAMPGGAIYGQHSHGFRRAFLRPANHSRRWRGLYFVGGSTHPGGGTPTVLMSSAITARLMQTHET